MACISWHRRSSLKRSEVRAARRRQSALERLPTVQPPTLGAYGYPSGVAGLAQVAEEIHAMREALQNADPVRWVKVLRSTEHPVHRQPGQGSERAALAILREAASGKRGGADAFLSGLGYPQGQAGEARLLASLRRLRAALAEQQTSTLGRTVWRVHWSEVNIPVTSPRRSL